jgi:nucleotide-binding universal stress UspA family protein
MVDACPYFKPTNILVPTDFSASSDTALAVATDMAQHFHARLFLLHVLPEFPIKTGLEFSAQFNGREEFLKALQKQAEDSLLASITGLAEKGLQARFVVEVGDDVVGNVLAVVEREQVDMVVLSTHGMSGWRPMIFGSTAEKVIKLLHCPLLLLRSLQSAATVDK